MQKLLAPSLMEYMYVCAYEDNLRADSTLANARGSGSARDSQSAAQPSAGDSKSSVPSSTWLLRSDRFRDQADISLPLGFD